MTASFLRLLLCNLRLRNLAREIFLDGCKTAIQKVLSDIAKQDAIARPRRNMGYPVPHGSGADNRNCFDLVHKGLDATAV